MKRASVQFIGAIRLVVLTLALAPWVPSRAAGAPAVVVSIQPVHSLVAGVMQGIAEPTLIVKGAGSPHTYALRPSEATALQKSGIIFWVGEDLETFLQKPLRALPTAARTVELAEVPGVTLLPYRTGSVWQTAGHAQEGGKHAADKHEGHAHGPGELDMHIWLDPANAKAMVAAIVAALSEADPAHAEVYRANGQRLSSRLEALDAELRGSLAGVRDKPYVVFHDAYQYFERRYGLSPVGSVTASPERQPGASRLAQMRETLLAKGVHCVFREPQFEPAWIETLTRGTPVRVATLDPIGADLQPGPDAYFETMRRLASSLAVCLK